MLVVNLKKAVVKLTYGDYNGKFSMSGKSWKCDSSCGFLLASGTNLAYTSSGHSDSKIMAVKVLHFIC